MEILWQKHLSAGPGSPFGVGFRNWGCLWLKILRIKKKKENMIKNIGKRTTGSTLSTKKR
jgi:hypothetical protein